MANQLPEDVLANILRHLAPRCLATSRCVCKPWCTIIDARRLLRAELLPLSVGGIFINFHDLVLSEFFSRPSTGPTICDNLDYLPCRDKFRDHCNGLLLLYNYVVNPVTRQWVQLPPLPSPRMGGTKKFADNAYLVFDPTLSPHYEVFLIPRPHFVYNWFNSNVELDPAIEELEWPPSPCVLHVFSSRTKEWEERSFVREGEAAGTVSDMRLDWSGGHHNAVYWRGALYVHCQTNFVMRISLSDGKYQVIKPPVDIELFRCPHLYLGRSEKGVYCALNMRVYILNESKGKMEWVCKSIIGLSHQQIDRPGPWTLQDINYHESHNEYEDGNDEAIVEQKFEWDSDNDSVIDTEGRDKCHFSYGRYFTFLGFHPYKEVVFLSDTLSRGLAYHLNSSKVQDLGNLRPTHYGTEMGIQPFIEASFPYTPWMGEFPEGN